MRGHSPNISQEVEDTLVFIKGHFPDMKPRQIQTHIKQNLKAFKLKENQVPSVRSIQNKLNKAENRKKIERIKNDALNQHWNIGLGRKYGIPAYIVPILIQIKQIENNSDGLTHYLTIRKARWVEYLYPTLEPIFRRQRPKLYSEQRIWLLYIIAEEYAKLEEIYEIKTGEKTPLIPAPDTSDLDYRFLVKEDISDESIVDVLLRTRLSETADLLRSLITDERAHKIKEHPITKGELKQIWGDVSQKFVDRLNIHLQKAAKELEQYQINKERDGEQK